MESKDAALALGVVLLGLGIASSSFAFSTAQPALPATVSGSTVIQLPPCDGQAINSCTLSQSWSASLLSPSQALAVYVGLRAASPGDNTCHLIALYSTSLPSASYIPIPSWGGTQSVMSYSGTVYLSTSIPGYSGNYAYYTTADGCLGGATTSSSAKSTSSTVKFSSTSSTPKSSSVASTVKSSSTSSTAKSSSVASTVKSSSQSTTSESSLTVTQTSTITTIDPHGGSNLRFGWLQFALMGSGVLLLLYGSVGRKADD